MVMKTLKKTSKSSKTPFLTLQLSRVRSRDFNLSNLNLIKIRASKV